MCECWWLRLVEEIKREEIEERKMCLCCSSVSPGCSYTVHSLGETVVSLSMHVAQFQMRSACDAPLRVVCRCNYRYGCHTCQGPALLLRRMNVGLTDDEFTDQWLSLYDGEL